MNHEPLTRFAVCSDVHGNLPALQTFLELADSEGYDRVFCCGDVVGYGANPNECCDLLRERGIPTVLGNHDQAAIDLSQIALFNEIARTAILWTHNELTPENYQFLSDLPFVITEGDFTFVHASPWRPSEWNYVLTEGEAKMNFTHFDNWMCFIGHSHQPFEVELQNDEIACPGEALVTLSRDKHYLVNVGSIGQPRDRIPMLCFVTVDLEKNQLEFRRVEYPVPESQQAILDAGLPPELADRLAHGW